MNKIEQQFVNYSQAKELKELGFDEPCYNCYNEKYPNDTSSLIGFRDGNGWKVHVPFDMNTPYKGEDSKLLFSAPLKQQIFSFALTKHSLCCSIIPVWGNLNYWYSYQILNITNGDKENYSAFETYKQAESECIDKLISLIKQK